MWVNSFEAQTNDVVHPTTKVCQSHSQNLFWYWSKSVPPRSQHSFSTPVVKNLMFICRVIKKDYIFRLYLYVNYIILYYKYMLKKWGFEKIGRF